MNMDFFQFCCLKHAVDVNNHTACVGQNAESIPAIHLCFCANDSKLKGHMQLLLLLLLF
jgi:hypothetical protein